MCSHLSVIVAAAALSKALHDSHCIIPMIRKLRNILVKPQLAGAKRQAYSPWL
jgi:hypothetical protein